MTHLSISAVKVTLQNKRWEVAVRWDGLPFLVRHGTGDSIEEAVENALKQVLQDQADQLVIELNPPVLMPKPYRELGEETKP